LLPQASSLVCSLKNVLIQTVLVVEIRATVFVCGVEVVVFGSVVGG